MNLAPIVLFVYNRARHTRLTVEALQRNILASKSDLFIYADGPSCSDDFDKISEVLTYIRTVDKFRSVTIVERDKNFGLASSIPTGVTELVNNYGKIIVLEDDIVTSPYFLLYMNEALERYRDSEKLMHIAGYMYPIDTSDLPQTILFRQTSCWGWATWQRAWRCFEPDAPLLASRFDRQQRYHFNIEGSYNFWEHLRLNCTGSWDTWAIKWYASVFLSGGLCLHPVRSLVLNIGLDASGTNCGSTNKFDVVVADEAVVEFDETSEENQIALARIREFLRPSLMVRMLHAFRSLLH